MTILINIFALAVFIAIAVLFSNDRKSINKKTVVTLFALNIFVGWFLTSFTIGREIIMAVAEVFNFIIGVSYEGVAFALADWVNAPQMNFVTAALLPIFLILPLCDILTYFGILPFMIKWTGRALSFITRSPKFESFYAVEMVVLGNPEVESVSAPQLRRISPQRCVTLAIMSMSCVSASIIGSYIQMMPAQFVLAAIPLNVVNALIVAQILYPVKITPEEDDAVVEISSDKEKPPFFSYLGASIINAGKMVFIVASMVIAFVSLIKFINAGLALINPAFSLEAAFGFVTFPLAWLLVPETNEAFQLAQFIGMKFVTNEFVVMLQAQPLISTFSTHMQCVLTVFTTSFANLGTLGIIIGGFKGVVDEEKNYLIATNVKYMMLSGVLVSLLSAGIAGLFVR